MPNRTLTINNADGSSETYTINRDKFEGVREMTRGYVYPTITTGSYNSAGVVFQKLPIGNPDEKTFTLVASNSTAQQWVNIINPNNGIRTGKHRMEFDLVLNSGSISSKLWWNYTDNDDDPYTGNGYGYKQSPTVGHNSFDFEIFNDGVAPNPHVYFDIEAGSNFVVSVTNFKITHEPDTVTVDHTEQPDVRTLLADGETITIDTTREGVRTLTVDGETITIDRTEESNLKSFIEQFTGATAAYSLRDLASSDGNTAVVRVRRGSDNQEADFTATEVSNGTLTNWVNTQTVLPLDIQEIADSNSDGNNDGRVGNYLIAKAAYSLRSLGTRQATLAATGDTVARADGQFVAQVRRSSDDAVKSFTATEITDGTLVDWVGTSPADPQNITGFTVSGITNDSDMNGTYSQTGTLNGKTKWANGDGDILWMPSGYWRWRYDGDTYFRSYEDTTYPWDVTTWTEEDGSGTPTVGSFVGGSPTASAGSGFVKTWYDQSVTTQAGDTATGNHAFQDTPAKQPTIVKEGNLVKDANDNPAVEWDNVDDNMNLTSELIATGAYSIFTYHEMLPSTMLLKGNINAPAFKYQNNTKYRVSSYQPVVNADFIVSYPTKVVSILKDSSNNIRLYSDGTESSSGQLTLGTGSGENANFQMLGSEANDGAGDGKLFEFIYYETDQTDDRLAIEANIGEAYNITGIPAYDNTVDGFVETWYDQSGNGNDAVQATAANQPKIVDAGTLVSGGVLITGSSEGLEIASASTLGIDGSNNRSIFSVLKTPSGTDGFMIFGSEGETSASYRKRSSNSSGLSRIEIQGSGFEGADISDGNTHLFSSILDGTQLQNVSIFVDGSETSGIGTDTLNTADNNFFIGSISSSFAENTGTLAELIVYASSQTDNRLAIEANIANQYDITLS